MKHCKILSFSISNSVAYFLYFVLFTSACLLYYVVFVSNKGFVYEPVVGWLNPVNIHDHYVYLDYINNINNVEQLFGLNNNLGIALVYYLGHKLVSLFGYDIQYEVLALLINVLILLLALKTYINLVKLFGMPQYYVITFFFLTSLVYFSQLINKDSFTILIFLKAIELSKKKHWLRYMVLITLSLFIRFQLPVLLIVYAYMVVKNKKPLKEILLLYIASSLLNGYLAKYQTHFFNERTLSDGLSFFVYQLNIKYYIGSLLFNPLRVIQYLYDTLLSFDFINEDYKIDVSRLKNIPQLFILFLYFPFIINCFVKYKKKMHGDERFFMAIIVSFFLIWLFNPTINQRYFICVLPIFQLLGLFQLYKFRKGYK